MLKKNQLALILLTLVLMLSVYFIRAPFSNDDNEKPAGDTPPTSLRLEELSQLRTQLSSQRDQEILELDQVISSDENTVLEKKDAYEKKELLRKLTGLELALENEIIQSGFRDAFVKTSGTDVEITIVSEENITNVTRYVITRDALKDYQDVGLNCQVSIIVKTAAEVMGTASES